VTSQTRPRPGSGEGTGGEGKEESRLVRGRAIMDAVTVARAGHDGLMRGDAVVIPGAINRVQPFLPRLLPRAVVPRVVRRAQARAQG
jgi:uncharacterized protein